MGTKIKIISLIIGVMFFLLITRYIRKNSFKPSYSFLWFAIAFFLLSVPLFEPLYKWFSTTVIGIIDAQNIIYIVLIGFLLVYSFYLTIKISKLSDHVQQLISFTAILQNDLENLGKGIKNIEKK
jgi:hypothetical protein